MLREADGRGVSREYLIFTCKLTQCGRAINSLEKRGYVIEHVKFKGERYVRYILQSEPLEPKSLATSQRKPSDYEKHTRQLEAQAMPLFTGAESQQ